MAFRTQVKDNWNIQKGKLKENFSILTDGDLLFEQGKKHEMLERLQLKLGKTSEELTKVMNKP